jgi:hypothetical protein
MREYIWRSFRGVGGTDLNGIGAIFWGFYSVCSSRILVELNLEVEDDTWVPLSTLAGKRRKTTRKEKKR